MMFSLYIGIDDKIILNTKLHIIFYIFIDSIQFVFYFLILILNFKLLTLNVFIF